MRRFLPTCIRTVGAITIASSVWAGSTILDVPMQSALAAHQPTTMPVLDPAEPISSLGAEGDISIGNAELDADEYGDQIAGLFGGLRAASRGFGGASRGAAIGRSMTRSFRTPKTFSSPSLSYRAARPNNSVTGALWSPGNKIKTVKTPVTNFTHRLKLDRNQVQKKFRKSLGLKDHDGYRAHHIVPVDLKTHPLVKRAAKGGFDLHGVRNGVPISKSYHVGSHPQYTVRVRSTLDAIWAQTKNKKLKDWQYAQLLHRLNWEEAQNLKKMRSVLK